MACRPGERISDPRRPIEGFPPGITSGLSVPAFFLDSGSRSAALKELHTRGDRVLAWQWSMLHSGSNNDVIPGVAQTRDEGTITAGSTETPADSQIASQSTERPASGSFYQAHQAPQGAESAQYQLGKPKQPEHANTEAFRVLIAQIPPMRPRPSESGQTVLRHPGSRMIVTESGVVFHL
eukprot:TRINITY_DN13062_c0_g1_i1.p1 TRINITY_DN13062_c0_g1~~TRINITY_DN13062_c0_g1_i1.p1  ORF type:complete len:196 (-),score=24.83 TRINITY_DN13062_c0_g1_i1:115-654(-)